MNYDSYLYRDPLLQEIYLTNQRLLPITPLNLMERQVEGDPILDLYVHRLNSEIYGKLPDGLTEIAEALWISDDWRTLMEQVADATRLHGWCVVQFYDDENIRWNVLSVPEFEDWIKDPDADGKLIRTGVKFKWADDLGNQWEEECLFAEPNTHLIKWREGNGRDVFAFPDVNEALMTLVIEYRQMHGQMTFSAAKPSFLHFVYGEDADDDNITLLDQKIKHIDTTTAIGLSETILKEIRSVENTNLSLLEPALDRQIQYISAITHLPTSFFIGEKQSSGMSDMGEKTDMLKVRQKKEFIFNALSPYIKRIFNDQYGIGIDILLPQDETLEEIEEDGQEPEEPNSREEAE